MAVRPIDANELYRIEKLLDTDIVRQDKVALNLLEQVLYDIQHVPALTPQNEWISVEDRLPPNMDAENIELKERIVNWRNYMAPTRERVEKVWRGEWIAVREVVGGYKCSRCKTEAVLDCNDEFVLDNFCPRCGAAMTDEAVDMMMERMEKIK